MTRSRLVAIAVLLGLITCSACSTTPPRSAEQRTADANTAAGKIGQAAHKAAVETDKAAQAVGRQINKAARDARAGWNEQAKKDQSKKP